MAPASDDVFNLWPGHAPGAVKAGQEAHAMAAEIPVLKLFLLPGERVRPLVVVLPGGGYCCRAPHEADPVAQWLNGLGLHAAVCHYRVFPWQHPVPLADAQRAVRLVRAHAAKWRVDPERIGILGFSAGGHLACSVANFGDDGVAGDETAGTPSRVNALIACYPVASFSAFGHSGSRANLIGETPDPELVQRLSLENTVTPQNPQTFLWHTADDEAVPVMNSLLYAGALSRAKVSFALHVYPHAHHGIGLGRDYPSTARGWTEACAAWLHECGWR
jgi:acetyl esterase/lipase